MVNPENTYNIHIYAYTQVGRIHRKKKGPWIGKRERKDMRGVGGRKGWGRLCNIL